MKRRVDILNLQRYCVMFLVLEMEPSGRILLFGKIGLQPMLSVYTSNNKNNKMKNEK